MHHAKARHCIEQGNRGLAVQFRQGYPQPTPQHLIPVIKNGQPMPNQGFQQQQSLGCITIQAGLRSDSVKRSLGQIQNTGHFLIRQPNQTGDLICSGPIHARTSLFYQFVPVVC